MSENTQNLFDLFTKLLRNPEFIMAIHQNHYRHSDFGVEGRGPGRVLRLIAQHDGLTNSEIAEILDIRPSSVTALVNKLVERDFVEKEPLENDKRVTILKLTAKGKQAISHVQTAQESLNQEVFANLTAAEQEQFVHLLTKLLDNLKHIDLRDQRYQALQTYCSPRHHFPRFEPGSWERYSGLKHHHW